MSPVAIRSVPKTSLASAVSGDRPRLAGKYFVQGERKFLIKGATYGEFRKYDLKLVERDFSSMAAHGFNTVRTYSVPPRELLDVARRHGLFVMVGLPWEQHIAFLDEPEHVKGIADSIAAGVRQCAGHPAVLCYAIGNEIPASIVRYHGRRRIERHIARLYQLAKEQDPSALVTYVNYPSTEYLDLPFLDFCAFNVYLESQERLESYLGRLQNIAGDRPLVMAEIGLDSRRHGEITQARVLEWQLRTVFAAGCAGAMIFAWTDEWFRGGCEIEDWDFGLTRRNRDPKPALTAVAQFLKQSLPQPTWCPKVSVVVCSFNGARTIRDCLDGLCRLDYPNYEIIVVNDGSTDGLADIVRGYPCRLINTENCGLSSARNTGIKEAKGDIIAYLDDDAWPDSHWLTYLVRLFESTTHAGVGGPNIPPPGDGHMSDCVANAPGGPIHVLLSDQIAEHIPGCNMAFRKECLEAIGGFDPQFRSAGDDVDVCWRLQERGWTLGFHAGAMVWHHRRNTVRAYWRQQRGYGRAEALLEKKWPEKYQAPGSIRWGGRAYGRGLHLSWGSPARIYHGSWGVAPFQALYQPSPTVLRSIPLMPEWYLILGGLFVVSLLGMSWNPLTWTALLFAGGATVTVLQAGRGAVRATLAEPPRSRRERWRLFATIMMLYLVQPMARLTGRIRNGLTPWRQHVWVRPASPRTKIIKIWRTHRREPEKILRALEGALRGHGTVVHRGGDFDRWDLEVRSGMAGSARLLMGVEEHGAGKQLVRFRVWPRWSVLTIALGSLFGGLAVGAAIDGGVAASVLLSLAAITLLGWAFRDCATALTVVLQALEEFWPETLS